ncbi:MAG: hypothetical protein ABIA04_09255 [Pseudomonadota bacterium]
MRFRQGLIASFFMIIIISSFASGAEWDSPDFKRQLNSVYSKCLFESLIENAFNVKGKSEIECKVQNAVIQMNEALADISDSPLEIVLDFSVKQFEVESFYQASIGPVSINKANQITSYSDVYTKTSIEVRNVRADNRSMLLLISLDDLGKIDECQKSIKLPFMR